MKKFIILTISTYIGNLNDAEHYYGTLKVIDKPIEDMLWEIPKKYIKYTGKKIDITRKLSKAEAEYLSKKDKAIYNENDTTNKFSTKQDVIDAGIELYQQYITENKTYGTNLIILTSVQDNYLIYIENFYEYLLTNDKKQELLYFTDSILEKYTLDKLYDKMYNCDSERKYYPNDGLKMIPVYKEHPGAKYKYGQIFKYNDSVNHIVIICGIIFNDELKYLSKPIHCDGHYSTHSEKEIDSLYTLIQL